MNKSFRWTLGALPAALALALAAGGYSYYERELGAVRTTKVDELRAIADLKVDQIVRWREERLIDARLNVDGIIRTTVLSWLAAPTDPALKSAALSHLRRTQETEGYPELLVTSTDGRVLLATDAATQSLEASTRELVVQAAAASQPVFGDFYLCRACDGIRLEVASAIVDHDRHAVAVVILRVDPGPYFFPLIQAWPLPSESGETLLVRKDGDDVLFLNVLRHRPDAALTFRIPLTQIQVPAVQAVQGRVAAVDGIDYRGVPVLADARRVPDTPWFLVAKVDTAEILAEARYRGKAVLLFVLLGMLTIGVLGGLVYSLRQRRLYQDLYRAEKAASEVAADLARSNRDLEQFAYVASHDLQEPLRAVAGFMGILRRQYAGRLEADAQDWVNEAIAGAERMQNLIQDLLTYSRVGTRGAAFVATDMQTAMEDALANLRAAIGESEAVVTHDPLPTVAADSSQMIQLLQNLIGNAIKFRGGKRPEIYVSATHEDHGWLFGVRDNGIGIEPQYYDRIFLIFQRLHSRTQYPGTGIGLAVCKKIIERHSGRIWIESAPGAGTTFWFTIPDSGGHP